MMNEVNYSIKCCNLNTKKTNPSHGKSYSINLSKRHSKYCITYIYPCFYGAFLLYVQKKINVNIRPVIIAITNFLISTSAQIFGYIKVFNYKNV